MADEKPAPATAGDLSRLALTPEGFHDFHGAVAGLRFPIEVAQVLELRYLINQAADAFAAPPDAETAAALESLALDNQRHRERLRQVLAMLHDLHSRHIAASTGGENRLRAELTKIGRARAHSIRYGLIFLFAAAGCGGAWFWLGDPGWTVKLAALGLMLLTLDYLRSLPVLKRQARKSALELDELLRRRVTTPDWKTLAHSLALVLGYKQPGATEVFRVEGEADGGLPKR